MSVAASEMANSKDVDLDLLECSERLINLTGTLNLEDFDKSCDPICQLNQPFVCDFVKLRDHICEQRKTICIYGLDRPLFDDTLFRKMQVLASRFVFHTESPAAYCNLRSSLFLEVNEFFDEMLSEVDIRLTSCTCEEEIERLVRCAEILRVVYDIYM